VRGPVRVERVEVRTTVTLPDSFMSGLGAPVRVWPRVGGTYTARGAFRMPYWTPWAQVIARDGRSFTLQGFLYRIADTTCAACAGESWLPLPPDQARFGFTVLGPVRRVAIASASAAGRDERLAARPSLFRSATLISGPAGGRITIFDPSGRVMRRASLDGRMGAFAWDGRDERGSTVRPGLYFVRCDRPAGPLLAKVVRLE